MADIFLSYNREDQPTALDYARALESSGFSVWWDTTLKTGDAYDEVTEKALRDAKAVVVLWSRRSVVSRWVKSEATLADRLGTLVPVMIDECERPIMFELVQTADLAHWKGNVADPEFKSLISEIRTHVAGEKTAPTPVEIAAGHIYKLPSKPSIALLPFVDLAGAKGDDYFADGIVEEISAALANYPSLFVIAGSSSLTYRDTKKDLNAICRELGVRYLLEGSVRRSGDRVRINIKLNDGIMGEQVWADKFDGTMDDVFDLQDRVAGSVARTIDSTIENAELRRATITTTKSADTYELFWRANAAYRGFDPESMTQAISLLEQVVEREPSNPWALSLLGFCHASRFSNRWGDDIMESRAKALEYYEAAIKVGGENSQILCYCAAILVSVIGDMQVARRMINRALELTPESANTLFWGGFNDIVLGNAERGLERFEGSLRVNPTSSVRPYIIGGMGICLTLLRRFEEGASVLQEALQQIPNYPAGLAALAVCKVELGQSEEAAPYYERLRALGGVPGIMAILQNEDHRQMVGDGLTKSAAMLESAAS